MSGRSGSMIRRVRDLFPPLDKFLYRKRMLRVGEDSIFAIFENDALSAMAYELYCNSLYYPVSIEPDTHQRSLIDAVSGAYFLAISESEKKEEYASFMGGVWQRLSGEFAKSLKDNASLYTNYLSIGARSYKSFKLAAESAPFKPAHYRCQVALTCMQFDTINSRGPLAPLAYEGYHQYNYPHFYYKNIPLNTSLYSYEMADYVIRKQFLGKNPLIAEIGSGDGSVARDILSNIPGCKYILFDLPEILTRSQFLLSTRFPDKRIASLTELKKLQYDLGRLLEEYDIIFLPAWHVLSIPESIKVDLWINTHSLGEMPIDIAKRYCGIMDKTGEAFISINRCRDIPFVKNEIIHDTNKYLPVFKRLKVREVSYPVTSNYMFMRPSNVRLFLKS